MQPRPLLPLRRRRPCRPVPVSGGFPAQSSWPETEVTAAEIGPKIERSKVADNGHLIRLYDTRDAARIDKYDTVYRGFLYEFEPQMQLITEAYLMSAVISGQEPNSHPVVSLHEVSATKSKSPLHFLFCGAHRSIQSRLTIFEITPPLPLFLCQKGVRRRLSRAFVADYVCNNTFAAADMGRHRAGEVAATLDVCSIYL